jgi:hypothetical protein
MGLMEALLKKEKKPKKMCIPDHAKKGDADEPEEISEFLGKSSFRVEGLYELKGNTMITGTVLCGKIKLGSRCTISGIECSAAELSFSNTSVDAMDEGQHGLVTLNHPRHPVIKVDDIIEFA